MREDPAPLQVSGISEKEWGPGYHLWNALQSLLAQRGPEGTTSLVRVASHLVLILVAVGVLLITQLRLPKWEIVEIQEAQPIPEELAEVPQILEVDPSTEAVALVREAAPITLIPDRPRTETITHTVAPGDTLYALAQRYGVRAETLMWANGLEQNPDLLRLGQKLIVLPINGVLHTVAKKDTVESIAKKYKAKTEDILNYKANALDPQNPALAVGQKVVVPGGSKPIVVRTVKVYSGKVPQGAARGTGRFVWPTSGRITQGYKPLHRAVDIAGAQGWKIKAADTGWVVVSGWSNAGYGYHIVIDHGNGFQTLYAHLSRLYVQAGDKVGKGTVIGLMGTTGRSTGPHLHFEVRQRGVQRNPFSYLP